MKISKIISVFLAAASFSSFAYADDLTYTFENHSKDTLSFAINHVCSTQLGDIKNLAEKSITQAEIVNACAGNPDQCAVDIYVEAGCAGKASGNIIFNKKMQITSTASDGRTNFIFAGHFADVFVIFTDRTVH